MGPGSVLQILIPFLTICIAIITFEPPRHEGLHSIAVRQRYMTTSRPSTLRRRHCLSGRFWRFRSAAYIRGQYPPACHMKSKRHTWPRAEIRLRMPLHHTIRRRQCLPGRFWRFRSAACIRGQYPWTCHMQSRRHTWPRAGIRFTIPFHHTRFTEVHASTDTSKRPIC